MSRSQFEGEGSEADNLSLTSESEPTQNPYSEATDTKEEFFLTAVFYLKKAKRLSGQLTQGYGQAKPPRRLIRRFIQCMTKACFKGYATVQEKAITDYVLYLTLISSPPHKVLYVTEYDPESAGNKEKEGFLKEREINLPSAKELGLSPLPIQARILRPLFVLSTQYREILVFDENSCSDVLTGLLDRRYPSETEAILSYYGFRFTDNPSSAKTGAAV